MTTGPGVEDELILNAAELDELGQRITSLVTGIDPGDSRSARQIALLLTRIDKACRTIQNAIQNKIPIKVGNKKRLDFEPNIAGDDRPISFRL